MALRDAALLCRRLAAADWPRPARGDAGYEAEMVPAGFARVADCQAQTVPTRATWSTSPDRACPAGVQPTYLAVDKIPTVRKKFLADLYLLSRCMDSGLTRETG